MGGAILVKEINLAEQKSFTLPSNEGQWKSARCSPLPQREDTSENMLNDCDVKISSKLTGAQGSLHDRDGSSELGESKSEALTLITYLCIS
jgi:hypothetical protein